MVVGYTFARCARECRASRGESATFSLPGSARCAWADLPAYWLLLEGKSAPGPAFVFVITRVIRLSASMLWLSAKAVLFLFTFFSVYEVLKSWLQL